MSTSKSRFGYTPDGRPVDYRDEDGILWIYHGTTRFDFDHWCGILPEDQI